MDENPGQKFGEISRIVAERWRQMSDADKHVGFCWDVNFHISLTQLFCILDICREGKEA